MTPLPNYLLILLAFVCLTSCGQDKVNVPENTATKKETPIAEKTTQVVEPNQVNEALGKFDPSVHGDFVKIDKQHADRTGMFLRKEVYDQFIKMYDAALKDGVKLVIRSATRNFDAQKGIWEGKWTGKRLHESNENLAETTPNPKERALKILLWSSMPGTSRHHWGTDIDLNSFENSYFESGNGLKLYQWLVANASSYGFCQPYTEKGVDRTEGYNEEKWHWSYLPRSAKHLRVWKKHIENEDVKGFLGSETAKEIDVKNKYVLGLHPSCK